MKFDIRVGICLAVLATGAACSQSPQAPTAPSATQGSVAAATGPDGSTLKFNTPALVSPVERTRAEDRRPTLVWANAQSRYGGIGVAYDLQVETATARIYEQTVGETPDFGAHLLPFDLEFDTVYFWRVRARVGNEFGPWSSYAEFMSPSRPVSVAPPTVAGGTTTCAAPPSPMGAGETRKPRPNDSNIVRQVASTYPGAMRNSCQEHGGSWEFMDRVVDTLRAKDGRYGYNAKRGNMNDASLDAISYFWGNHDGFNGSTQVYIFDIISGHCGASPASFWGDVTDITYSSGTVGRSLYPRRGRNVTESCGTAATAATAGQ
jgi:hypothetical protein